MNKSVEWELTPFSEDPKYTLSSSICDKPQYSDTNLNIFCSLWTIGFLFKKSLECLAIYGNYLSVRKMTHYFVMHCTIC